MMREGGGRFSNMDIEFANERPSDPLLNARIDKLTEELGTYGEGRSKLVERYFKDVAFFNALPEEVRNSDTELSELIRNCGRFDNIIESERSRRSQTGNSDLFGEKIEIPETQHADGRTRRIEVGYKVNTDALSARGIDPTKVLFFRISQPSSVPKPEYYWTSDYFETQHGLMMEIPSVQRKTAITLVASLSAISSNEGLIQDVNDDSGLAVRQIGAGVFDQQHTIARIE